jgi:hypothetical protein
VSCALFSLSLSTTLARFPGKGGVRFYRGSDSRGLL